MIHKAAIVAGAFGGIVPNLLRLAVNLTSNPSKEGPEDVVGYSIGMCVLALLGAVMAWAWQEKNVRRALYLGLGLPSLIQVVGLETDKSPPNAPPAGHTGALPFISTAYAEEPTRTNEELIPGRKLNITGKNNPPPYTVVFFRKDGQQIATQSVTTPASAIVDVPANAATFAIRLGGSTSDGQPLPKSPNGVKQAEVKIKARKSNGFKQALGFGSTGRYDIDVDSKEINP